MIWDVADRFQDISLTQVQLPKKKNCVHNLSAYYREF